MGQGYGAWSIWKTVLRWDLGTITHLIQLPPRPQEKVEATLAATPRTAHTTSLSKGHKLLGMLSSITPAVSGSKGMFTRVQHSLKKAAEQHVHLTADMNNNLEAWRKIVCSLASRPTHLRDLQPFYQTWISITNALGSVMVGVCRNPEVQYFV